MPGGVGGCRESKKEEEKEQEKRRKGEEKEEEKAEQMRRRDGIPRAKGNAIHPEDSTRRRNFLEKKNKKKHEAGKGPDCPRHSPRPFSSPFFVAFSSGGAPLLLGSGHLVGSGSFFLPPRLSQRHGSCASANNHA